MTFHESQNEWLKILHNRKSKSHCPRIWYCLLPYNRAAMIGGTLGEFHGIPREFHKGFVKVGFPFFESNIYILVTKDKGDFIKYDWVCVEISGFATAQNQRTPLWNLHPTVILNEASLSEESITYVRERMISDFLVIKLCGTPITIFKMKRLGILV